MNIQISNLDTTVDNEDLIKLFSPYGTVTFAQVVKDVFTETSRGFGFVEMEDNVAGQNAIKELHNSVVQNQTISVVESQPKTIHRGSYKVGNGPVEAYRFNRKK